MTPKRTRPRHRESSSDSPELPRFRDQRKNPYPRKNLNFFSFPNCNRKRSGLASRVNEWFHRLFKGGIPMFTIWGNRQGFCDGVNRRNFLKIGAFGAGLTLADMLRLKASASNVPARTPGPTRQKSAIMIYLPGGPSHMDMYDLKP